MAEVEMPTNSELGESNVLAADKGQPEKKPRKRLKKICSQIRDQVSQFMNKTESSCLEA